MVRDLPDNSALKRPVRTCVGCRQRATKQDLLRVVVVGEPGRRALAPDPRGKEPGRGAHLHPRRECLDLALRRRAFPRAFRLSEGLSSAPLERFVAAACEVGENRD